MELESEPVKICLTPTSLRDQFSNKVLGFTASTRGTSRQCFHFMEIPTKLWEKLNGNSYKIVGEINLVGGYVPLSSKQSVGILVYIFFFMEYFMMFCMS